MWQTMLFIYFIYLQFFNTIDVLQQTGAAHEGISQCAHF